MNQQKRKHREGFHYHRQWPGHTQTAKVLKQVRMTTTTETPPPGTAVPGAVIGTRTDQNQGRGARGRGHRFPQGAGRGGRGTARAQRRFAGCIKNLNPDFKGATTAMNFFSHLRRVQRQEHVHTTLQYLGMYVDKI